jgi:hypothetical protein
MGRDFVRLLQSLSAVYVNEFKPIWDELLAHSSSVPFVEKVLCRPTPSQLLQTVVPFEAEKKLTFILSHVCHLYYFSS